MSQKPNKPKKPSSHRSSRLPSPSDLSIQDLQQRWDGLHLHEPTRQSLEHIATQEGMALALAATTLLALEMKREEEISVSRSLGDGSRKNSASCC